METRPSADREYVLGHEAPELERLRAQADFYRGITEQSLRLTGIGAGMRVLDVGCGAGDVTLLASRLVEPSGEVIGVDRAPEAVAAATARAQKQGFTNVSFRQDDIAALKLDSPVDAVIGRLILMYLADPVLVLRNLATQVTSGGVLLFLEMDMEVAIAVPEFELASTTIGFVKKAFSSAGFDTRPGLLLHEHFVAAGLPAPTMLSIGRVEAAPAAESFALLGGIVGTLLPVMEKSGIASAEQIGLDTLEERLQAGAVAHRSVVMTPPLIAAWSHVA